MTRKTVNLERTSPEAEEWLVSKAASFDRQPSRLCKPQHCEWVWTNPYWDTKLFADSRKTRKGTLKKKKKSVCFFFSENEQSYQTAGIPTSVKNAALNKTLGISCLGFSPAIDRASTAPHHLHENCTGIEIKRGSLGRKDPVLVKSKMLKFSI